MTRELLTRRHTWTRGRVGDGYGHSLKLSIKLLWEPRDVWAGVYWDRDDDSITVYVCLIPLLPVRVRVRRSYSGTFPRKRIWQRPRTPPPTGAA